MNPENQIDDSTNSVSTKTPLTKIKKSRFQRKDSSTNIGIDGSVKIPLSSSIKTTVSSDNSSHPSFKGNYAMYPNTILKPVKFSIPKRMPSKNRDDIPLKSSADISKEKLELFKNRSSHNYNINKQNNDSSSKEEPVTKIERRGRKKKNVDNKNDLKNQKRKLNPENMQEETDDKINEEVRLDCIHEHELRTKINVDINNQTQDEIKSNTKKEVNTAAHNGDQCNDTNGILFRPDPLSKPSKVKFQIARSISARNPSANTELASDSNQLLNKTVRYLLAKKKMFFGADTQICRTTSKPLNSANFPKTPFEYVRNRPVPILSHFKNSQFNSKLLKFSSKEVACSHSDDEAHDIYEAIKPRIKLIASKNNRNSRSAEKSKNEPIAAESSVNNNPQKKNQHALSVFSEQYRKSLNIQNLIKENESKTKSKAKHAYGENTSEEIGNYLINNRIKWDLPQNSSNKDENEKRSVSFLEANKISPTEKARSILKMLEKNDFSDDRSFTNSNEKIFQSIEEKEEKSNDKFIPPYFREHQCKVNHQNDIKNVINKEKKRKKISYFVDAEELNQMQEVTRQYGICEEAFRPFSFNTNKKTSNSSDQFDINFSQADGFFELDDDEELFKI